MAIESESESPARLKLRRAERQLFGVAGVDLVSGGVSSGQTAGLAQLSREMDSTRWLLPRRILICAGQPCSALFRSTGQTGFQQTIGWSVGIFRRK